MAKLKAGDLKDTGDWHRVWFYSCGCRSYAEGCCPKHGSRHPEPETVRVVTYESGSFWRRDRCVFEFQWPDHEVAKKRAGIEGTDR